LSLLLLVVAGLCNADLGIALSLITAHLGMGMSLANLVVANFSGRIFLRSSVGRLPWLLPAPFVMALPTLLFGGLAYGLAGEAGLSQWCGIMLIGSLLLIPMTAVLGNWIVKRGELPQPRSLPWPRKFTPGANERRETPPNE
jgi:hypothetical protein